MAVLLFLPGYTEHIITSCSVLLTTFQSKVQRQRSNGFFFGRLPLGISTADRLLSSLFLWHQLSSYPPSLDQESFLLFLLQPLSASSPNQGCVTGEEVTLYNYSEKYSNIFSQVNLLHLSGLHQSWSRPSRPSPAPPVQPLLYQGAVDQYQSLLQIGNTVPSL